MGSTASRAMILSASSPSFAPGDLVRHKTSSRRMVVTGCKVAEYTGGSRVVVWVEWMTDDGSVRRGQFGSDSLEPL